MEKQNKPEKEKKLFDLYKQIDAHVKLPIKINRNEQQQSS